MSPCLHIAYDNILNLGLHSKDLVSFMFKTILSKEVPISKMKPWAKAGLGEMGRAILLVGLVN